MSDLKNRIQNTRLTDTQTALFYTGQVGFIIKYHDKTILIDGYLSEYLDHLRDGGVNGEWTRKFPTPIRPEDLDFIDYVFCTHAHCDHADPDTLSVLAKINKKAVFYAPASVKSVIINYGIQPERIQSVVTDVCYTLSEADDMHFTVIPSAHEELHMSAPGSYDEVGYRFQFGDTVIYHSGDCCMYDGLTEKIKEADIVMVPVNGRDYFRNRANIIGCFDSTEAVLLAKEAGASMLVPTHYGLYSANDINPAHFVDVLMKLNPAQRFHMFAPGERYIYEHE